MDQERLATELKTLRYELGMNLREASNKTGLTKETISDLERARRVPTAHTLKKLADAYGVSIRELIRPQTQDQVLVSGKDSAPPVPLGEELPPAPGGSDSYPYPWMLPDLARTIESWRNEAIRGKDPRHCYVIAVAAIDLAGQFLRFDLPGDTLPERVPEEEVEARLRVVRWLAALSDQAQSVYAKSPEAEPEVTEEYAERRAKFYVILGEAA